MENDRVAIKDLRDAIIYIDDENSMIRNFEKVLARGQESDLKRKYPKAIILETKYWRRQ